MIAIRPANLADAQTIADFNIRMAWETEQIVLDSSTVAMGVRAILGNPARGRYFVAELDDVVIGQLMLTYEWSDWRNGEIWWIQSVYVAATHRRMGVFTQLFKHVESLAKESGVAALRLYVERDNRSAQETYARLGMTLTHYALMELPLTAAARAAGHG